MLNPAYKIRQHDRGDLFARALAVPYADIVLFEAHWTRITSVVKLTDLYRTRVARKPKDLLSMLRQLDYCG
jgi:hypothetical protein